MWMECAIRFVSVHMNPLERNANRMRIVFNPCTSVVDWKQIKTLALISIVSRQMAFGRLVNLCNGHYFEASLKARKARLGRA